MINSRRLLNAVSVLSFLGFLDAAYLTLTHFQNRIPPCTLGSCETVLTSQYAAIFGIPIAMIGAFYYVTVFLFSRIGSVRWLFVTVSAGFAISLVLLGLQLFILHAICLYCIGSLTITTLLFILGLLLLRTWQQPGNFT